MGEDRAIGQSIRTQGHARVVGSHSRQCGRRHVHYPRKRRRIRRSLAVTSVLTATTGVCRSAFVVIGVQNWLMGALRTNLGDLPTAPAEQNRLSSKQYKATETAPTVVEAHKLYLLYRDMAAISFLLLLASPVGFFLSGFGGGAIAAAAGIFAVQYLIAAISAPGNRHAPR
jgi:hypothetical protein